MDKCSLWLPLTAPYSASYCRDSKRLLRGVFGTWAISMLLLTCCSCKGLAAVAAADAGPALCCNSRHVSQAGPVNGVQATR
jgi:hypothetical protein